MCIFSFGFGVWFSMCYLVFVGWCRGDGLRSVFFICISGSGRKVV